MARPKKLFLFDVDGTLTESRQRISAEMRDLLREARGHVYVAFVGGSDLQKQEEQVGSDCLDVFDFSFPENGVSFYRGRSLVSQESILKSVGEDFYRDLVDFSLRYVADLEIPTKRGTFIELRRSMVNISPIGRNCTQDERMAFFEHDKKEGVRAKMKSELDRRFGAKMQFSIGGQISIDGFPLGWDKTYCLRHLADFDEIVFFGDMTMPGGNDYEIFSHERVVGVSVGGPHETYAKVKEMLKKIAE